MKFKLKEATVAVREESIRVRELTHGERIKWVKTVGEDQMRGPACIVALGALEPKLTEEEVGELPADVVSAVVEKIMELSGMLRKPDQKEPNAGGAVSVPARSGAGSSAE